MSAQEPVVWIPVETYDSKINTEIFLTHEIIHALHYQISPHYYFSNKDELIQIQRQLITEGIATYGTKTILSTSSELALWGDYLSYQEIEQWLHECNSELENLKFLVKNNLLNSDNKLELFYANMIF